MNDTTTPRSAWRETFLWMLCTILPGALGVRLGINWWRQNVYSLEDMGRPVSALFTALVVLGCATAVAALQFAVIVLVIRSAVN